MHLTGSEGKMRQKLCAVYRWVCAFLDQTKASHPIFPKVVYLDCVYNWDITTLSHASQILGFFFKKKSILLTTGSVVCVTLSSLDCFIYLKRLPLSHWFPSNPLRPYSAAENPHMRYG